MLGLSAVLAMASPLRLATLAAITSILLTHPSQAQTFSKCNPTQQSGCPPDPALGKSVSIDFRSGASNDFTISGGTPKYTSDGATLTIASGGDAPTFTSNWYIMFGHVEVVMKAAPGAGIVSSSVLQSADLDEIDWEWLGSENDEVQSNYFSKGAASGYGRAAVSAVTNTQGTFHKYTVDWTPQQIVWQIDGQNVRVLTASDAGSAYPQTPMQLKIGVWAGGDPNTNAPGTVEWAKGPTNFANGPFSMVVQSVAVTDYSTGTSYTYGDTSGTWGSIKSNGGTIDGNAGGSLSDTAAPAITSTASGAVPFDGTHAECSTCSQPGIGGWNQPGTTIASGTQGFSSYPGLPPGWSVSSSGKVVPPSGAPSVDIPTRLACIVAGSLIGGLIFRLRI